eukprot:m51a1_g12504 putative leucine rich repeat protein (720) ;mRNA; f:1260-4290
MLVRWHADNSLKCSGVLMNEPRRVDSIWDVVTHWAEPEHTATYSISGEFSAKPVYVYIRAMNPGSPQEWSASITGMMEFEFPTSDTYVWYRLGALETRHRIALSSEEITPDDAADAAPSRGPCVDPRSLISACLELEYPRSPSNDLRPALMPAASNGAALFAKHSGSAQYQVSATRSGVIASVWMRAMVGPSGSASATVSLGESDAWMAFSGKSSESPTSFSWRKSKALLVGDHPNMSASLAQGAYWDKVYIGSGSESDAAACTATNTGPTNDCDIMNGNCDLATRCSRSGKVCSDCPFGYGGTGKTGCTAWTGTCFATVGVLYNPSVTFPTSEVTVEFWVRLLQIDGRGEYFLFTYAGTGDFSTSFSIKYFGTGRFAFLIGGEVKSADVALTEGVWYHVAVSWSKSSGDVNWYLNDKKQKTIETHARSKLPKTGWMAIGRSIKNNLLGNEYLLANIDELRVWSRVLPESEFTREKLSATFSSVGKRGLAFWWQFDCSESPMRHLDSISRAALIPDFTPSEVLEMLFVATDGPNWAFNKNWLKGDPCKMGVGEWYGIDCDAGNNVIAINLGFNNLGGTLPSVLSMLTSLKFLYLHDNNIGGQLPDDIAFYTATHVYLNDNKFTGQVPDAIDSMCCINKMYLQNNLLSGSIPALSSSATLTYLSLANNKLSGSIPSSIGQLSTLNYLDASNNDVSGEIPAAVINSDIDTMCEEQTPEDCD